MTFVMANPTPEIFSDEAKKGGVAVVGETDKKYISRI